MMDAHDSLDAPVNEWSIEQVCQFLDSLGLPSLIPAFRENAVSGSDLLGLSDDDYTSVLKATKLQIRKIRNALEEKHKINNSNDSATEAASSAPPTIQTSQDGGGVALPSDPPPQNSNFGIPPPLPEQPAPPVMMQPQYVQPNAYGVVPPGYPPGMPPPAVGPYAAPPPAGYAPQQPLYAPQPMPGGMPAQYPYLPGPQQPMYAAAPPTYFPPPSGTPQQQYQNQQGDCSVQ